MFNMLGMSSAVGSIERLTSTCTARAILIAQNGKLNVTLIFGGTFFLDGFILIMAVEFIHGYGNLFVVFLVVIVVAKKRPPYSIFVGTLKPSKKKKKSKETVIARQFSSRIFLCYCAPFGIVSLLTIGS